MVQPPFFYNISEGISYFFICHAIIWGIGWKGGRKKGERNDREEEKRGKREREDKSRSLAPRSRYETRERHLPTRPTVLRR